VIRYLIDDVKAVAKNDPAAHSVIETLLCHTPLHAIAVYRLAHFLHRLHIPILPRFLSTLAKVWSGRLNIKSINADARVIELSGGNQQKVVIAKSLVQKPRLVIFDEPTRGVDVGAIAEIHQLIGRLADEGMAIVVISSYLPEIMNLSDRILVTQSGRVVEEFTPEEATEKKIMHAAVH